MHRLTWLDITKGLAILWIVCFHLFSTYAPDAPSPLGASYLADTVASFSGPGWISNSMKFGRMVAFGLIGVGFHGVGLFLIVSGWSLTQSCLKQVDRGTISWPAWYRKKLFRLFPMYWVAHLVYVLFCLASYVTARTVFIDQFEPLDSRVFISLTGLRFIDINSNMFYLNAAWWYFTMLIQLYLVFPLFFAGMGRIGAGPFLLIGCAVGFGLRYLMLIVAPAHHALWAFADGMWVQGGFGLARLPEFALGMSLGVWHRARSAQLERLLLNGPGLALSLVGYPFALLLYRSLRGYIFVDAATGMCFFLLAVGIAGLIARLPRLVPLFVTCGVYSYGIYLIHQPHVIFLGLRIRDLPVAVAALVALAGVTAVSLFGIGVEKNVNALIERVSAGRAAPA
jgi:peptidoglycan/LPS O-acetylase OafA/YrhL